MNRFVLILFFALITLVTFSCSRNEVDGSRIQETNGILFAANENSPYSGRVSVFHKNGQKAKEGIVKNGILLELHVWDSNGHKTWAIQLPSKNDSIGTYTWWNSDGKVAASGEVRRSHLGDYDYDIGLQTVTTALDLIQKL